MAGIGCFRAHHHQMLLLPNLRNRRIFQCCCFKNPNSRKERTQTPEFLKLAVSGVTELLRLFSPSDENRSDSVKKPTDESLVSNVDDILMIIKSDYEKAYFVTGLFTSAIYADDCTFEDPTIKFQGRDLYSRNLKLLVPFFDDPSIFLKEIKKDINPETKSIIASWKLRTYLKLPWRPLILVDGTTTYEIDDQLTVIRHVERWKISALEAVGQIFTPGFLNSDK